MRKKLEYPPGSEPSLLNVFFPINSVSYSLIRICSIKSKEIICKQTRC